FPLLFLLLHFHSFPTRRSSDLNLGELLSVFVTPDRLLEDEHVFRLHRCRRTQNLFHLCLAHARRDLVIILERQLRSAHDIAIARDRKSTRLNSSHTCISYAVFC